MSVQNPLRPPWTAVEDRKIMAASPSALGDRWRLVGETEMQRLSREIGRSAGAIRARRRKLGDPAAVRQKLDEARATRDARDRELIRMVSEGLSVSEAAQCHGISASAVCRVLRLKAPGLDRTASRVRVFERQAQRTRIASAISQLMIEAAERGEGVTFSATAVADLVGAAK